MGVKSFMFPTFLFCQLFCSKRYQISKFQRKTLLKRQHRAIIFILWVT